MKGGCWTVDVGQLMVDSWWLTVDSGGRIDQNGPNLMQQRSSVLRLEKEL